MSNIARTAKKSTWTPLTNEEANHKIFEERRALVSKWFEKWSHEQRKRVLKDVIALCRGKQLNFIGEEVNEKKPVYKDDFTRGLPRVLTLYVFSYLDPRSLCRCSQVCWYWKYLTELDHLWMPKCVSLGWILPFSPSPYENGVWKKLYIENIVALKCLVPKQKKDMLLKDLEELKISEDEGLKSGRGVKSLQKRPPWRGSDPNPKDMWRNNYLENDNEVEKVTNLRKKHLYGPLAEAVVQKAKNKVRTGQHAAMIKAMHAERSKSEQSHYPGERPDWAQTGLHSAPFMDQAAVAKMADASVRPIASTTSSELARAMKERSVRDLPSKPLFPSKNSVWQVPDKGEESDT